MTKSMTVLLCAMICLLASHKIYGQATNIVSGTIKNNQTKENLSAVSVIIKGSTIGTFTDEKGNFRLVTTQQFPLTLTVTSIGYLSKDVNVESASQTIDIELDASYALGQEIVVAATRMPQRILESPVTIERLNANALRNTPGPNYYDALANLKGVDVNTSSYTFKTISTRGFNGSGNLRLNQLVDGMDNSAPALNFSVGNVIGLTDLDVDNMELLSGASSALYGSGGMNGTLLISSKDPFKYQGFSIEVKEGLMHVNDYRHSASPMHDFAFRWGKKVSDKFAFKIGAEYIKVDDWRADDSTNLLRNNVYSKIVPGTRASDPNYDGVNVYGDEVSAFIPPLGFAISRTGYYEKDLVDYNAYNFKISGGLYYKISSSTEVSLTGNWGEGTTVYTGADRYSLKNFSIGQYKLEIKNPNWFLRAYTTQENSGDSYATTLTAISVDRTWESDGDWFNNYAGYRLTVPGATDASARAFADAPRYLPGTTEFNSALKKSITTSINDSGSQFSDKSSLYQFEGQYNFTQFVKVLDVLVGADYRSYHLNSNNTIFYEPDGPINIGEYGTYVQLQKQLFNDILKLTAAGRYDKSENFKGRFTPRVTATVQVAKNNNIRLSYQQAYRFPNNQDQYINLFTPGSTLIGCLPVFNTLYHFDNNPVYTAGSIEAYRDSFALSGVPNSLLLNQANFAKADPETMESYEIGYRGIISNKLLIDAYYYFSKYKNFIGRQAVARGASGDPATSQIELLNPFTSRNYSFVINSPTPVKANGWGFSAQYQIGKGYTLMGNVYGDQLTGVPSTLITFFNTPKTRFNLGLSNSNTINGFGFNIIYKWQDKVNWEGTFGTGPIPAFGTLDAQVSYKFTKEKVLLKIGGTNITNHYYRNAFGNPYIGALYYASIGYNIF